MIRLRPEAGICERPLPGRLSSASMYSVSTSDKPRRVSSAPQSSVGAPCPVLFAGEHTLRLAYYLEPGRLTGDWTSAPIRAARPGGPEELCAIVSFDRAYAHMFGPPNDEAFAGHPLAARGLEPYSVFEVEGSSWLHRLVQMNSVHPYHRAEQFKDFKHWVFSFHDTTFECIALSFTIDLAHGTPWSVLEDAVNAE